VIVRSSLLKILATCLAAVCVTRAVAEEHRFAGRTREEWVGELDSGNRRQRSHAAWALSQFAVQEAGPQNTMVWLNELYLLVESDSPSVRYWGLVGLGQFLPKLAANHPARATAVQVLATSLKDQSPGARLAAAEALARAGQTSTALPVLVAALKDPQEATRIQAAMALENLGESARAALPEIKAATSDVSEYVKRISLRTVGKLEQP
jgi:HEAT repeat protein